MKTFTVDLEKEHLIFSAAHFITFGDSNICESLHGHNYRVRCRVTGHLNEHGYVVDFIALRDRLREVVRQLDHHVLLPDRHPQIQVQVGDEVVVTFAEKRWVFPRSDCMILPIDNTTAERLAEYLFECLQDFWIKHRAVLDSVELGVDENEGQWGSVTVRFGRP